MIQKHYEGISRRAVNMIWNAAGSYDFDPPYQAFFPGSGGPDLYFDLIIGLVWRWLDPDKITGYLDRLGHDFKGEAAKSLLWLGLENNLYRKEVGSRPRLTELRADRAQVFYDRANQLSRQEMMVQNTQVFVLEDLHWSRILNRKPITGVISQKEKKMAQALVFDPAWDTDQIVEAMNQFVRTYTRVHPGNLRNHSKKKAIGGPFQALADWAREKQWNRTESLKIGSGDAKPDEGGISLRQEAGLNPLKRNAADDRAYIRASFGPLAVSEEEIKKMERNLCRGTHAYCRIWLARSGEGADRSNAMGAKLASDQARQREANLAYLRDHSFAVQAAIQSLQARMDRIFTSYTTPLPHRARSGRLEADRAYRLPILHDPMVFRAPSDQLEYKINVNLLLDASKSRMYHQEVIASQAYIIARAFESLGIPVRVMAFRSLRGYTILQELKAYNDKEGQGIFSYYAGGWNRDGLGFAILNDLFKEEKKIREGETILLALTDASPNDSTSVPPGEGSLFRQPYEGALAVEDSRQAIQSLIQSGIKVGAIFLGAPAHLDSLHRIYNYRYSRIHRIGQLAEAVGGLLEQNLINR